MIRPITEEDLRPKGFPFECSNCGNKPTPQQVVEHHGDCDACGDAITAHAVDTAEAMIASQPPQLEDGEACALFGVPLWNPLRHGIHGEPLMVRASDYNRVASNLADALSFAIQHVPLDCEDAEKIYALERAATIAPNLRAGARRYHSAEVCR